MQTPDPTKDRLLEAAGLEFAERGFESATIRSICARAGANLAAVNYHFGDKEQLYTQVVLAAHRCCVADLAPAELEGLEPEEQLRLFIDRFLRQFLHDPSASWHYQVMVREMLHPSAASEVLVRERIQPRFGMLRRILERLAPGVDDRRLLALCFSVVGQCLYYRMGRPIAVRIVGAEALGSLDVAYLTDHITRFTLAALGRGEPVARPEREATTR